MLGAFVFGMLSIALLERARRVAIDTDVRSHAYELYALRDELREAAIRGEVKPTDWVFSYLDSSIAKTIGMLPRINLLVFIGIAMLYRHDRAVCEASHHLKRELERPRNVFLKQVHERYIETILALMIARQPFIRASVSQAMGMIRLGIWLKVKFQRAAEIITESPEASTLDQYAH